MANHATPEHATRFQNDTTDGRHGTRHGYTYFRCRCADCRTANTEYQSLHSKTYYRSRPSRRLTRDVQK